jgi:hypothetical protein
MTDKIADGTCCTYPGGTPSCNSVYHSCANIAISGSQDPAQFAESYNYTGLSGPYAKGEGVVTLLENIS